MIPCIVTAQSREWSVVAGSTEIKKVFTYKNSATYALAATGGLFVLDHKTSKVSYFDKYNSPMPSSVLTDVAVSADSVIYLASDGAGLIRIRNGKYESIIADSSWVTEHITSVDIAPNGSELSQGIYTVRIETEHKNIQIKFIK